MIFIWAHRFKHDNEISKWKCLMETKEWRWLVGFSDTSTFTAEKDQ